MLGVILMFFELKLKDESFLTLVTDIAKLSRIKHYPIHSLLNYHASVKIMLAEEFFALWYNDRPSFTFILPFFRCKLLNAC